MIGLQLQCNFINLELFAGGILSACKLLTPLTRSVSAMKRIIHVAITSLIAWQVYVIYSSDNIPQMTMADLVERHGYPLETYQVHTEDGYILTMFRINKGPDLSNKPVALLQHGLASCSTNFVAVGPNTSLAFLLADRGYDVWIGNIRGNRYSQGHISYDPFQLEFWNFSMHELGFYDLAAMVDFALNKTGMKNLNYISHSMGSNLLLILLSTRTEYQSKIKQAISFSPAAFVNPTYHFGLKYLSLYYFHWLIQLGHGNWFPKVESIVPLIPKLCQAGMVTRHLCSLLYTSFGPSTQMNETLLPTVFSISTTSTSLKVYAHLRKIYLTGEFQQLEHEDKSAVYNLSLVKVPLTLMHSDNDWVIPPENVKKLHSILPNATLYRVPLSTFNHLDYLFGKDVVDLVYKKVFNVLDNSEL